MASMDLPTLLVGLNAYRDQVLEIIKGLENEECSHVTAEEKALLETLRLQYVDRLSGTVGLTNATQYLMDLGYPTEPTLNIPEALVEKLSQEAHAGDIARALFHGIQDAVSGILKFSEPQEKP